MNYRRKYRQAQDRVKRQEDLKRDVVDEWVKAESPYKPGDTIYIPDQARVYKGLRGLVTNVNVTRCGKNGTAYFWLVRGKVINRNNEPDNRPFTFRIEM